MSNNALETDSDLETEIAEKQSIPMIVGKNNFTRISTNSQLSSVSIITLVTITDTIRVKQNYI